MMDILKSEEEFRIKAILNAENPFSRANLVGHITSSGLVINDGKALLIFHPYIK